MSDSVDRLREALADRYGVEEELGAGGMAIVYLAQDLKHARKVAVKVLRPELAATLGPERFLREIRIAAGLQHPHILPVLDSGETDGFLYYVMPYVEGESLRAKLVREGELPINEAVRVLREIADALAKAHDRGIVHRDIKPDNVLIADGHAVVMDFGVAKAVSDATGRQDITTAGVTLGTPTYMAPEQAVADPHIDHRADIYTLGVVAYEALAGRTPFDGRTPQQVLSRHVTEAPVAVTTHRAAVPAALEAVVMRCLEKKPADRWQSAAELRTELDRIVTPSGGTEPVRAVPAHGSRIPRGLAAGVAAAVLVGVAFFARGRGERGPVVASAARMAVMPFAPTVDDSGLSRLGRDLVVLLSRNLDGVGDIRTVDASTILARTRDAEAYTLREAADVAASFGASSFVDGTLVRVGTGILVDAAAYETEDLTELARASVRVDAEDLIALTDSATWALLGSLWRSGDPPSPSLGAVTTRSLPALTAFLEGERAIGEDRFLEAPEHFRRAFEADTSFLLAYFRYWRSRAWYGMSTDSAIVNRVRRERGSLPEQERLLVNAVTGNRVERLAAARRLTEQYPDYWPGWMEFGDQLYHVGGYLGYAVEEGARAFERVTALNPDFLPAWQHLGGAHLIGWELEAAAAAFDSLEARSWGPDVLGGGPILFSALRADLRWTDGDLRPPPDSVVEFMVQSVGGMVDALGLELPRLGASPGPVGQAVLQRVAGGPAGNATARAARLGLAWHWASRGAWDSAFAAVDEAVRRDGTAEARMDAYRLAVFAAWSGAITPDVARARALSPEGLDAGGSAEVAWLDGILAVASGDREGLEAALDEVGSAGAPGSGYLAQSLEAFGMAMDGNTAGAARRLADAEWELSPSPHRFAGSHVLATPVNRLAAAAWLAQAGEYTEAVRLLRFAETSSNNIDVAVGQGLAAPLTALQQARIAEADGRPEDALDYYNRFLMFYNRAAPGVQGLLDEAQAALARLSAEGVGRS